MGFLINILFIWFFSVSKVSLFIIKNNYKDDLRIKNTINCFARALEKCNTKY